MCDFPFFLSRRRAKGDSFLRVPKAFLLNVILILYFQEPLAERHTLSAETAGCFFACHSNTPPTQAVFFFETVTVKGINL